MEAARALAHIRETDGEISAFVAVAEPTGSVEPSGALRGRAVAVKDLYRVDGYATRAGSTLPPELFDGPESTIVGMIRAAGGVVVGKTAMDEFAYCEPPATKNPLDPRRTPGGSSGGSAAAVAAGMCDFAIGSQTLQSTIVPAAYCGVVGFKPTFDRWEFDGVALAPSFDTVGFFAPTAAALRSGVAAIGQWPEVTGEVAPPRVGVPSPWGRKAHAHSWRLLRDQVAALAAAGWDVRPCDVPWSDAIVEWAAIVGDLLHAEMAAVHAPWFDEYAYRYRPRTRAAVERGRLIDDARLAECRSLQRSAAADVDQRMDEAGVDVFVSPAVGDVAPIGYDITGDSWMTSFWSLVGLPCVTVPVFEPGEDMPRGLQLVGRRGDDERLVGYAALAEAAVARPRPAPQ